MSRKESIEQGPRHVLSSRLRVHAGTLALILVAGPVGYLGTEKIMKETNVCPDVSEASLEMAEQSLLDIPRDPPELTFFRGVERGTTPASFFEQYDIIYFTEATSEQRETEAWKRQELQLMLAFSRLPVEYIKATKVKRVGLRYAIEDATGQAHKLSSEISFDYQELTYMSQLEVIDVIAHELYHLYDANYCGFLPGDPEFRDMQVEDEDLEVSLLPHPGYVSEYSTTSVSEAKAESAKIHIDLNQVDATARARVALAIARVEQRVPGFAQWMASERFPGFLISSSG